MNTPQNRPHGPWVLDEPVAESSNCPGCMRAFKKPRMGSSVLGIQLFSGWAFCNSCGCVFFFTDGPAWWYQRPPSQTPDSLRAEIAERLAVGRRWGGAGLSKDELRERGVLPALSEWDERARTRAAAVVP